MYTPRNQPVQLIAATSGTHITGLHLFFVLTKFLSLEIGMITMIEGDLLGCDA
jgi:hypothetical protein